MASYNLTINLGSGDEGKRRSDAVRKTASDQGVTLNQFIKKLLDKAISVDDKKTFDNDKNVL